MASSNFNLRNVAPNIMSLLKKEANKRKMSMNSLVLQFLEQGLGITYPTKKSVFHDLDYLAGTWSNKDQKTFNDNTKSFEKIDEELWL
jgi:hypothetical protein